MTTLPLLGYAGMLFLVAFETMFAVRHAFRCHTNKMGDRCMCPLPHRFLSGRPFHGYVVTDATYWTRGQNTHGHVSPFQKLPGWQKRAWRTGPVLAVFGALVSWPLTVVAVSAAGCLVVLRCTIRGRRLLGRAMTAMLWWVAPARLRERLGRRHGSRMQDMAQALGSITGSASVALKPQIDWNPDYANAEPGALVATWYPPRGFKATPREKGQVEDLWRGRVGFDLVPEWKMHEDRPCVTLLRARSLPDLVYLRDYAEDLAKLPDSQIGLGVDDRGEIVCWDFNVENPHGLVVAGSRVGKTELNRSKVAQVTRKGGHVSAADCKRISFQGMEGIPGFELKNNPRDIRGMWELISESYEEMDRRSDERDHNPTAEFPRWLLTVEELGQFSEMTDDWWEELETEDPRDAGTLFFKQRNRRRTPRVWRYIKSLCFEGAEFAMHVDICGQDGDHKYLKGVKSVLGLRVLGGYQDNQWINCVGTRPVPQAPDIKGRFCLVNGRKQTWFQAFVGDLDKLESAAIWRDYARGGRRLDGTVPVTATVNNPFTQTSNGTVPAGQRVFAVAPAGAITTGDPRGIPVTLSEAVDGGYAPGATVQALRQDRYLSDKKQLPDGLEFPEPVAPVSNGQAEKFWSAELTTFNQARRGRKVA